jgi:hypothetical protein
MKAYFNGRYVDLVWCGRRGIRKKIERGCESFYCISFCIILIYLLFLRMECAIREGENMKM